MAKKRTSNMDNQVLEQLFNSSGNIAFLDAEFNAGMDYKSGERINEIISVGLVICDASFNGIKKYYTLVKPLSKVPIFPIIAEMTGITTDMLEDAKSFAQMSTEVSELVNKYNVQKIFTWGAADYHSLLNEKQDYRRRKKEGYKSADKWNYIELCTDVSGAISNKLLGIKGGLAINIENLLFVCDIKEKQEHNALTDALQLYKCVKYLNSYYPLNLKDAEFMKKRVLINEYYQQRSTYNSFRRFRATSKGCDLYNKYGKDSYSDDIRLKALMDDIKFLKGEIPYELEFDSIEEFFDKH